MVANGKWWADYERAAKQLYGGNDMGLTAKDTGGADFEPAPAGNDAGRCYMVLDLGTQYNRMFDNYRRQVFIGFELPNTERKWKDENGQEHSMPFTVGSFYTNSLSEKANLRHDLESWRGRPFTEQELQGFDLQKILGIPALVNVMHKEKQGGGTKAVIGSISPLPKSMQCPDKIHDPVFFSLEEPFDEAMFEKVPKGFQDMIKKSEEWNKEEKTEFVDDEIPNMGGNVPESDIPF